jgi:hypothetical protein
VADVRIVGVADAGDNLPHQPEHPMLSQLEPQEVLADGVVGTRDGVGAGDHDEPYHFGRKPRSSTPYPFSTRQYMHLLVLRGRVQDGDISEGAMGCAA